MKAQTCLWRIDACFSNNVYIEMLYVRLVNARQLLNEFKQEACAAEQLPVKIPVNIPGKILVMKLRSFIR